MCTSSDEFNCREMGTSVNLSVFVLIFYLFSYVFIVVMACVVLASIMCLDLVGYVMVCVMSSAYFM